MKPTGHPAREQLVIVARALGDLRDSVVFIGGAVAPLLQTEPPIPRVRPTSDVDAIIATMRYGEIETIESKLRGRGFSDDVFDRTHMHAWRAPGGVKFDLMPAGSHPGESGNRLDALAIETAERLELEPGVTVRHASPPAFVALKLAAHRDRAGDDPFASHDLEDVVALVASRPTIVAELRAAPAEIRDFVRVQLSGLLQHPDLDELLAGHLANAPSLGELTALVRDRLAQMWEE